MMAYSRFFFKGINIYMKFFWYENYKQGLVSLDSAVMAIGTDTFMFYSYIILFPNIDIHYREGNQV